MALVPDIENPKKPKAKLIGKNGNIFCLMGFAGDALRSHGMHDKADEMYEKITKEAKSYEEALNIIGEYVEIE